MALKLYYDVLSQPSRALLIFLQTSKIPFTKCPVALRKGEHLSEEYEKEVSRFKKVPVISHGNFKLTESVAILRYLSKEHQVPENLYPHDAQQQARVDEYLEWQHNNIRTLCALYFRVKWIEPLITGNEPDPKRVASYEQRMSDCLDSFEKLWLNSGTFITGEKLSAADIWAACEIEQPRIAGYDPEVGRPLLSKWLNNVRKALNPHYEEAHSVLNKFAKVGSPKAKL